MFAMGSISVIIPAYNHAAYVVESLESIFRQTRQPMEIIVIDDASSDDTARVIGGYLRHLPVSKRRMVRFIKHKKNLTPTPTFNEGMESARGDYLVFLPADDWYAPTMLAEEAKILDAHPEIGVVYSHAFSVRDGERRLAVAEPAGMTTVIGREEFGRLLTLGDFVPLLTAMVRRALVTKFGSWDRNLRFHADYEYFIRMAKHTPFAYLAKSLTYSRIHERNDMFHPDFLPSYEREFAYILEKHLPSSDSALQSLRHDAYHFYYFRLFMHYVVQGKFIQGLSFLWKSFLEKPLSFRFLSAWKPFGWYVKRKTLSLLRNVS